ncbi:MAG: flagellar hook-length control protein FliK [Pseudomonadota bacterium]|nr:flagellar hook-length control protein FliK [Pseudomonadota bacterium]
MVTINSTSSIFGKLKVGDSLNDNDMSGIENLFASFFSLADSENPSVGPNNSKDIADEISTIFTEIKSSLGVPNQNSSEKTNMTETTIEDLSTNILQMYETYKAMIGQKKEQLAPASVTFILKGTATNAKKDGSPLTKGISTQENPMEDAIISEELLTGNKTARDETKAINEFSSNVLKSLKKNLKSTRNKSLLRTGTVEQEPSEAIAKTKNVLKSDHISQKMENLLKGEQNLGATHPERQKSKSTTDPSKLETLAESNSQPSKTLTGTKGNNLSWDSTGKSNLLQNQLKLFDQNWDKNLAKIIERAIASGKEKINISLEPKRLGKMQISLSIVNNHTSIAIHTENIAASLILTGSEDRLSQMFEATGLKLSNFQANSNNDKSEKRDPNSNLKSDTNIELRKDDLDIDLVESSKGPEIIEGRKVINLIA